MEKTRAEELAKLQKNISISEFFTRNRHLLGFDNPIRALLMTVKEAVDNSLDACAEMNVLPEIIIEITQVSENRFKILVEDNGPGIVREQIPNIFAKLLYGSKFHRLQQSRGQQGIGISASVLYSQLTTGKTTKIISKTGPKKSAHHFELHIDTKLNEPKIVKDEVVDWDKQHGTRVELELEAKYQKGKQSVDEYIKQTAIVNPHATIIYKTPEKTRIEFPRVSNQLPIEPKEIKPHPHGIELGTFIKMLHDSRSRTVQQFLQSDFCRIGPTLAKNILNESKIFEKTNPTKVTSEQAEILFKALQNTKIMAPPTDCLSPIKADLLEKGLKKEINADFYITTTRPPSVYRGMPFQVEAGIAYGGEIDKEDAVRIMRFANRVPLLYQQGACSITEGILETNWKPYGLQQSGNNIPRGPAVILIHIASVWVPFTSEAKEAIAHYPEIIKEIKLAVQECGRKLATYIRKNVKAKEQRDKINLFEKYIPELSSALSNLSNENKEKIEINLNSMLKKAVPEMNGQIQNDTEEK